MSGIGTVLFFEERFEKCFLPRQTEYGVWYLAGYYVVVESIVEGGAAPMWMICKNKDELNPEFVQDTLVPEEPARYYSRMKAFDVIRRHYGMLRFTVEFLEHERGNRHDH